jgi:hypothetical protein
LAWWPGNQTTEDVVSGIHGVGRDLGYAPGKVGDGFNVVQNGFMMVPARAATDLAAQEAGFTFECWIKPLGINDANERRILAWTEGATERMNLSRYNHVDWIRFQDGYGRYFDLTGIGEGSWVHVAISYDPSTQRLLGYVNGVVRADVNATLYNLVTRGDLSVGGSPSRGVSQWFEGGIDELSFYDRPLSAPEIAAIYDSGVIGKIPPSDNQAPVVNAGPDTGVSGIEFRATLRGSASDDGLPVGVGL